MSSIGRRSSLKQKNSISKGKSKEIKQRTSIITLNNKISKKLANVKKNIKPDPGEENKPIIKCPNCLNLTKNYLQISCQHILCGVCISRILLEKDFELLNPEKKYFSIQCPICNIGSIDTSIEQIEPIIKETLELRGKIQKNLCTVHKKIGDGYCIECKKWICEDCKNLFHNEYFKDHHFIEKEPNPKIICKVHPENECDMFCNDCHQLVCHKCSLKGEYHDIHRVITIEDFKKESLDMKKNLKNRNFDDFSNFLRSIEDRFKYDCKNNVDDKKNIINELIEQLKKMSESLDKIKEYNTFIDNYFSVIKNSYFNFYYDLKDKEPTIKTLNFLNKISKELFEIEFKSEFQENLESIRDQIEKIDKSKFFYHKTKFIQHPLHLDKSFQVNDTQLYCIKQLQDGKLATAGSNNKVNIWNLETLKCEKELNEHSDSIFTLIQLKNGLIITGSGDKTIKIWDLEYDPVKYQKENSENILSKSHENSISHNENSKKEFSKNNYEIIDEEKEENNNEKKDENNIENSNNNENDKKEENKNNEEEKVSQSMPEIIIPKNNLKEKANQQNNNFQSIKTLEGHKGPIFSIIDLENNAICSSSKDNTIKIWSLTNYTCVQTLEGHTNSVGCLIKYDNNNIISGSSDSKLRVWDLNKENPKGIILSGHTNGIFCILLLEDGNIVSGSCDKNIRIWDIKNINEKNKDKCIGILKGHSGYVWSLIQLKDNNKIASGSSDRTIRIWDLVSLECVFYMNAHQGDVSCMCVLNDGKIATGSIDKNVKIWEE